MPVLERGQRELRSKVPEKAGHEKTGGAPATANRHVIEEPAPTRVPVGTRWER